MCIRDSQDPKLSSTTSRTDFEDYMQTDMDTGDRPAQLPLDCSNSQSCSCSRSCTSSSSNEDGDKAMEEEQAAPLKTDSYSTCNVNNTYCSSNSCRCSCSCTSSTSKEAGSKAMEEEQAAPLQPDNYSINLLSSVGWASTVFPPSYKSGSER